MNLSDARVRNTRQAIRHAFLELLKEKPVSGISVTELCEKSQINRTTFYKHYADVFDLLDCMEQEMLAYLKQALAEQPCRSLYEMFYEFLSTIQKFGRDWWVLGSEKGDPALFTKMFVMIYQSNFPRVQERAAHLPPETQEMLYSYLAQGSGGVIRWWIQSGANGSPEAPAKFLTQATSALTEIFMKKQDGSPQSL